jgi:hypothetical protein
MTKIYTAALVAATLLAIALFGCNTDEDNETGLYGNWNVTVWSEDGVADPDVPSYNAVLTITEAGVMTFAFGTAEPFNYTGNYTIDGANHINAILNETTGNSEINQWEMSVDANIGTSELQMEGTTIKRSPFWPDNTVAVVNYLNPLIRLTRD